MRVAGYSIEDVPFAGGALCLDFTNTVGWWSDPLGADKLHDYADLVTWSERAGLLDQAAARHLRRSAKRSPAAADEVLRKAIALREAIYRIFMALANRQPPKPQYSQILNQALANAFAHSVLSIDENGAAWQWQDQPQALEQMLWPIARSAADLLASDERRYVKHCANEQCGWLFLDASHNHTRRWCSMSDCGNRAKVNRFHARQRTLRKRRTPNRATAR